MSMDDSLQLAINELRTRNSLTWQQVGELIGISGSLAWRVAHGLCGSAVARHYFGLPQKMVEVLPCVVCGDVHVQKTCTAKHGRKRYRVALEFETKEEQEQMIELLAIGGGTRHKQSYWLRVFLRGLQNLDYPIPKIGT